MRFTKYHALGNDYIVVNPADLGFELSEWHVKVLCNRHFGFGSDGVLYGPLKSGHCDFSLKIFNPDGSEAEKSGNGLRIFSRYLWDKKLVAGDWFSIETKGGVVNSIVREKGSLISVEMGKVKFTHSEGGEPRLAAQKICVDGVTFDYYPANVGNPHAVILQDFVSPILAKTYGRLIENDSSFPNRTNVQFVKVIDRNSIEIEIWERGAGYTLASGSSSTATAAVVYALGLCDRDIKVKMPGGTIAIALDEQFNAVMTGEVCRIGVGELTEEAIVATTNAQLAMSTD